MMKRKESRISTSSISTVLDFQKLPMIRNESEDRDFSCPIENVHKIISLAQCSPSVVERVVSLGSLSDNFGPLTPRRNTDDDMEEDDESDIETELVNVAPMPTIGPRTPVASREHRPCDPVAKFLLSKC
ncbi:unnamed protein product [Cylindrotheca closterium]|uniref:Uncharacterized protein n=1 Tax=Cylindrotheca closterium TaxID=2856 RepID=A0AAD2JLW6_9STRA|nr:unnamed protein product [Cylindrotheca closterium]